MIEWQQYSDDCGIPVQKRLKPDTVPTIFPKSNNGLDTSDKSTTTPQGRPLSEKRVKISRLTHDKADLYLAIIAHS